jgi:MAternally-affected-uncoordination protein
MTQVCYYLMVGQVKSVKGILKQLQGSIQTVTSPDWPPETDLNRCEPAEQFLWLPRDQLCVLVYLITVMHSMQGGYMEKAERYTEKAIQNIMKLQVSIYSNNGCSRIIFF